MFACRETDGECISVGPSNKKLDDASAKVALQANIDIWNARGESLIGLDGEDEYRDARLEPKLALGFPQIVPWEPGCHSNLIESPPNYNLPPYYYNHYDALTKPHISVPHPFFSFLFLVSML